MGQYTKKNGISIRQSAGRFFIIDTAAGKIHHLNETAHLVWQWLDIMPPEDMAKKLASIYKVEQEQALADILAILERLKTEGLIHEE